MRWSVGYRVRTIALVALLTSAAIGVTGWVTARSTVTQASSSVDSQRNDIDMIAGRLTEYGVVHGVWVGVPALALELERETSLRVKLTTENGEVIVDTDTLHGRAARPASGRAPVAIVPRPEIDLSGVSARKAYSRTVRAISAHRENARLAACLTQRKVPVAAAMPVDGVAQIGYDQDAAGAVGCVRRPSTGAELAADAKAVHGCLDATDIDSGRVLVPLDANTSPAPADGASVSPSMERCLELAFQRRAAADDAVTLLLYVGFRGAGALRVDAWRLLGAAVPIVLLAIGCGVLLSRHVLRPVDAVIRASRRLESGHRAARVPERGHDEMAALARAFNRMADSVQRGDDQQRRMVADIAHELRTPLANIRGYLEALKDGVLAPSAEIFESLHEEALLQQRTIDDLQDLALADQQRLIDHRVRADLGELTRAARAAHAARADAAQVELVDDVEAGLHIDADPDRLRQAVGNLIANALRATGPGGRITLVARRVDAARVRLTVADTGHGVAAEHLPHLFDRFWRTDPARARKTGGSGLGLAITREIVRGHGGVIEVDSVPGAGAAFTVTLPAAPQGAKARP